MVDRNALGDGETRIGHVFDGRPGTPEALGQLERRDGAVTLSVFWESPLSAPARWFMRGVQIQDDPDRTKFDYAVPRLLSFGDERGSVNLVGCRSVGMNGQLAGPGRGRITARYVVMERIPTDATYETIQGLRTTVSGLREWLGVESIRTTDKTRDAAGRMETIAFKLDSPAALEVPGVDGLTLVPRWTTAQPDPDVVEMREHLHVETWHDDARPWSVHLSVHRGLRDLLAVSRWRREELTEASARADSDRTAEDRAWSPTVIGGVLNEAPPPTRQEHLIQFTDVGVDGVRDWLRLREDYQRAVDPLVSSLYNADAAIESKVSQAGIGLEALGFLLAHKIDGKTEKQADRLNYVQRFERIGKSMADVLPFAPDVWATDFAGAYNSVKHANRALPDSVHLANRWREAVLVFRAWVALELGVDRTLLRDRISIDPMAGEYVPID